MSKFVHECFNRSFYLTLLPSYQRHKNIVRQQYQNELQQLIKKNEITEDELKNELAKLQEKMNKFTLEEFIKCLVITDTNKIVIKPTGETVTTLYGNYIPKIDQHGIISGYSLKLRPDSQRYVDIYLNVNFEKLHQIIQSGEQIKNRQILNSLLTQIDSNKERCVTVKSQKVVQQALEIPVKYPMTNHKIKNVKLKLYAYQYNNIKWMSKVERSVNTPFKYCSPDLCRIVLDPNNPSDNRTIYYDKIRGRFFTEKDKPILSKYVEHFYLVGGALVDEMGRGKTACAIIHCLRNRGKHIPEPLTFDDCVITEGYDRYLKTSATLVFVPNQCCAQWKNEVKTITDTNVRVVMMTGKRDFESTKYSDIVNADFVICPYSFLKNNNCMRHYKLEDYNGSQFDKLTTYRFEALRNSNILEKTHPLFSMFYWKRIILDEAHEVFQSEITSNKQFSLITFLNSEFRWMLTGTPYAHKSAGFQRMLKWIVTGGNARLDFFSSWTFDEFLMKNINRLRPRMIRRNTNKSTSHETRLPPILNKEVWINFTELEKAMYNDQVASTANPFGSTFLRQFCCYPQLSNVLSNCKSMEEIHAQLIKHTKQEIDKNTIAQKINSTQLNTNENLLKNALESNAPGWRIREYSRQIDIFKRRLEKNNAELNTLTRSFNFLSKVMPKLQSGEICECTICLDDIVDIGVTKCGHIFCYSCVSNAISTTNKKCPTCRKELRKQDVYQVKNKSEKKNSSANPEFKKLINAVGSKLANIIMFLKKSFQSKHDHIIIFSQWNKLLLKVGEVLNQHGIDYVYCKGNRLSREKSIRLFNQDNNVRVILLSSQYASAGTNLTRANKIYFLEPVYGSKKFKEDIESQAVGRAHRLGQTRPVTIVRFLLKDTIEEQIHRGVEIVPS